MAIDVMFIIMAAFGFYFGYAYGLIRVVFFVASLLLALFVAMRFTPTTTQLIQETLEVDSLLLPFVSFVITLVGVMLVTRIISKLLEETVDSNKFNQVSQTVGGFMMGLVFIFLFSVLVTFFSAAHAIKPENARQTSFFYKYIEQIPVHGTDLLKMVAPFMESFVTYMTEALDRLEKGELKKNEPIRPDEHYPDEIDNSLELDTNELIISPIPDSSLPIISEDTIR